MKTALKMTAIAALAALATASAAQAAVTVSHTAADTPLPAGQYMVWDFDGLQAAGYGVSITGPAGIYDGSAGLVSGIAAPPPGTTTNYAAVLGGGKIVLTTPQISRLSVYMGSPDSYNNIRFNFLGGGHEDLTGTQLAAGAFNGDQSVGRRMTYDFGGQRVTSVEFTSSSNSFEFDNIATSAVPEPATWAMMIMGFGLAGSAMRQSRRKSAMTFA